MLQRPSRAVLACLPLALAVGLPADGAALDWVRAVRVGEPAPELGSGAVFDSLSLSPTLGSDGALVFVASSGLPLVRQGLYAWRPGSGRELLRTSDALRPLVFSSNASGEVAFAEALPAAPCAGGAQALHGPADDGFALVAETGALAPGAPGLFFADFLGLARVPLRPLTRPLLGDARELYFVAGLLEEACVDPDFVPPLVPGLFEADASQQVTLVALAGEPAPGAPEEATFVDFLWRGGRGLDGAGALVFLAQLATADDGVAQAVYRFDPARGLELLAATGEPQPAAGGASFALLGLPAAGEAGRAAFFAVSGDVPPDLDVPPPRGLWTADAEGRLERVYESGDEVPGGPPGATFGPASSASVRFEPSPWIDGEGELAFTEGVELAGGGGGPGVFGPDAQGALALRVLDGDAAPGIEGAVLRAPRLVAFGDDGDLAFEARLAGPDVDAAHDLVFYHLAPSGEATLLLREGDLFDFGTGDPLPVSEPIPTPAFDADLDRVALQVTRPFDPIVGGGIFVATIPEPDAAALAAAASLAVAALGARRRSRGPRYAPRA